MNAAHGPGRLSVPLLVIGSLSVIAFFMLLHPIGPKADAKGSSGTSLTQAAIANSPPRVPEYRATGVLMLFAGPTENYVRLGQVSDGAKLEVIGRNEKGDWLAVSLNPGSAIYGWTKTSMVAGNIDVASLPVAPVKPLP